MNKIKCACELGCEKYKCYFKNSWAFTIHFNLEIVFFLNVHFVHCCFKSITSKDKNNKNTLVLKHSFVIIKVLHFLVGIFMYENFISQ